MYYFFSFDVKKLHQKIEKSETIEYIFPTD